MDKMSELEQIIAELQQAAQGIDRQEPAALARALEEAGRVFVAGAGRSGCVAKAFANRLLHLGKTVYVVGDCTTPAITKSDLLLIISGSGGTASLVQMAKKAKELGAKLATATIFPQAEIGSLAEVIVKLPGATPKTQEQPATKTMQPMGSLFEQLSWLVLDGVILLMMKDLKLDEKQMFALHANLE